MSMKKKVLTANKNGLTYYCDRNRHLVCTPFSIKNLHLMAEHLKIGKHFFEYSDHGKLPHYDIPAERIQEITSKCNVVTRFEIVKIIKQGLKEQLTMKDELPEIEQPISLEHCFTILDTILKDKILFKNTLESNAMAMSHHGVGRYLRNNWFLWWSPELAAEAKDQGYPQEKPAIVRYFNEQLNITHADDMSGIILTSYHRHLNKVDLKLDEQIKKYKEHWERWKTK
jgi:hypothetical protein